MEDQDKNRIRELEKQNATLREDLAKRDEDLASRDDRIAIMEKLLKQQQGLGRGGI
jgi:hypothetical protein